MEVNASVTWDTVTSLTLTRVTPILNTAFATKVILGSIVKINSVSIQVAIKGNFPRKLLKKFHRKSAHS